MTLFFHFDLVEVIKWPMIRGQNFQFTHFAWCLLKYRFPGPKELKNDIISLFLTSYRSPNDFWPLIRGHNFEFINFEWCMLKYRFLGSDNPKMALFFHFYLVEVIKWPLTFEFKILASDQMSEVIWWPLWGQNEKNNVIFGFLGPKNLYFNIHHAKIVNSKSSLWSEVIW